MMNFIILNEIVDISKGTVTAPIYVRVASINGFKESQFAGVIKSTQVFLQNDCIWVTDTPQDIMDKCNGLELEIRSKKFGISL